MTPDVKSIPIDPALIQERYTAWAKLPATCQTEFLDRNEAWNLYCDARDGLPDGTSAARFALTIQTRSTDEERQLDIFRARRFA